VVLYFYKAFDNPNATIDDKIVALATFGNLSHVELQIYDNASYSSFIADGGVRIKNINFSDESWVKVDISKILYILDIDNNDIIKRVNKTLGLPYDYIGALLSPLNLKRPINPKKMFCSESIIYVLDSLKGKIDTPNMSPNKLYNQIMLIKNELE